MELGYNWVGEIGVKRVWGWFKGRDGGPPPPRVKLGYYGWNTKTKGND